MTHHPRHLKQSPTPRRPWSRQTLLSLAVAGLILFSATPAHAADITIPKGSTLWSLAAHYCGSGTKYMDLANGNAIKNPNRIYAGAKLSITCVTRPAPTTVSRSNPARTTPAATGWTNPLPGVRLSSCWGDGRNHKGLDMDGYLGQPIRAAASGTVSNLGWIGSGYGLELMIAHGGVWTHYAHLSKVYVSRGQHVVAGQIVAAVGNTGDVVRGRGGDGSHLHFEVAKSASIYSSQINPAPWLRSHGVSLGGC